MEEQRRYDHLSATQQPASSMDKVLAMKVTGKPIDSVEWLEERWVARGTELGRPLQERRFARRIRRETVGEYTVERWTEDAPGKHQRFRLSAEDVHGRQPQVFWDMDDRSFPYTLEAVPLRGEARVGESAEFAITFLANTAVPLNDYKRLRATVSQVDSERVLIGVTYSAGAPTNEQESGSREVDQLDGTLEVSVATGRPIRLRLSVAGRKWVYRFGGRVEPRGFTDNVQCDWSFYSDTGPVP
jgi:hypothetical protein